MLATHMRGSDSGHQQGNLWYIQCERLRLCGREVVLRGFAGMQKVWWAGSFFLLVLVLLECSDAFVRSMLMRTPMPPVRRRYALVLCGAVGFVWCSLQLEVSLVRRT